MPSKSKSAAELRRSLKQRTGDLLARRTALIEVMRRDLTDIRQQLADLGDYNQDWTPTEQLRWQDLQREERRLFDALQAL